MEGGFSRQDIDRIMLFVVSKLSNTQKIVIQEINSEVKSATALVWHISEKHEISRTAIWYALRELYKHKLVTNHKHPPRLSSLGKAIKELLK